MDFWTSDLHFGHKKISSERGYSKHGNSWQLHGHCHGSLDPIYESTRMDVGWDIWNRPISYEDIKRHMKNKEYKVVDHHFYGSEG